MNEKLNPTCRKKSVTSLLKQLFSKIKTKMNKNHHWVTRWEGTDNRQESTWHQQQTTTHVLHIQGHLLAGQGTPVGP